MGTAAEPLSQSAVPARFDVKIEGEYALSAFAGVRSHLYGIAHRMLGNAADAEDLVQDVWLRWQSTHHSAVENPPAFLAVTTTRLCINRVESAYSRRETHVDTWITEPVDVRGNSGSGAERQEELRRAIQLLLERLSPSERAAYVLREAFDYSYHEIACILRIHEANSRQLVSRARKHLANGPRTRVNAAEHRGLLEVFVTAANTGEVTPLVQFLANQ